MTIPSSGIAGPTREPTATYVVTDIEVDGPWPGPNSLRSVASVAVTAGSARSRTAGRDCFEAVLEPLPGSAPAPETLAWFTEHHPQAWAAATADPQPVPVVLSDWISWVRGHPRPVLFVASPVAFDGGWIDHYLRRFTRYGLLQGPYEQDKLFDGALCLHSFAAGTVGADPTTFSVHDLPREWFGTVRHTHRAIDDSLGYANLLLSLLDRAAG